MRSHHHHLNPNTTSSLANLMTGNGMKRVGMCESWITPRYSVGGWIGDSAFHKTRNRRGSQLEWGEKKLGSRPLVSENIEDIRLEVYNMQLIMCT